MALFTIADRDAVKAAMVTFAVRGIARVRVGGQEVEAKSLDELRNLLDMIQADLATAGGGPLFRMVKTVPPSPG